MAYPPLTNPLPLTPRGRYEKAVTYFERAAQIQPQEVKWKLMVASCHRRSGDYALAFEIYRAIHSDFPENVECLRYLVHICDDLGKKDQSHDYVVKLRAVERAMEGGDGPGTFDPGAITMQQQQQQQQVRPPTCPLPPPHSSLTFASLR